MAMSKRGLRPLVLSGDLFYDDTWTSLSSGAQWLYPVIIADPWTSIAGMGPVCLNRWANHTRDLTAADTTTYLQELQAGGRAIVCWDRQWLLLPRLLEDNGAAESANRIAGAIKSAKDYCDSPWLLDEFSRAMANLPARETSLAVGIVEKKRKRLPIPAPVRAAVYRRDEWTCQDCGLVILPRTQEERDGRQVPFDDANQLELDHIHPWSEGGTSDPENLQALCSRCNSVKGVRRLVQPDRAEVF